MMESMASTTTTIKTTRIRPTSARPAARFGISANADGFGPRAPIHGAGDTLLIQQDDLDDKSMVDDDNEDSPDDHKAAWHQQQEQALINKSQSTATLQFHLQQRPRPRFRPTSAPPSRSSTINAKAPTNLDNMDQCFNNQRDRDRDRDPEAAAAMSLEYLRAASERKKEKDRQFAMQLAREEMEYRKKMMLKTDQANKLSTLNGSKRNYSVGPDREGVHMIRVVDPSRACTDRLITVDVFLREFDKLSNASMGLSTDHKKRKAVKEPQTKQPPQSQGQPPTHKSPSSSRGTPAQSQSNNHHHSHSHSHSHSTSDLSKTDQENKHRMLSKLDEKARVQEEMKTVLANTIELTKVLQEQLHELKLRGWNFTSRTTSTNL